MTVSSYLDDLRGADVLGPTSAGTFLVLRTGGRGCITIALKDETSARRIAATINAAVEPDAPTPVVGGA